MISDSNAQPGRPIQSLVACSPGLYSSLLDRFSSPWFSFLERAFETSVRIGGLEHPAIKRPLGASFNPRPARLCQLLLDDARERDPGVLGAAMLAACREPAQAMAAPAPLGDAAQLAHTALSSPSPTSGPALRIWLAHTLDLLRHLHMTDTPPAEKIALWRAAQATIPAAPSANEQRLCVLIAAWGERFERSLSQETK